MASAPGSRSPSQFSCWPGWPFLATRALQDAEGSIELVDPHVFRACARIRAIFRSPTRLAKVSKNKIRRNFSLTNSASRSRTPFIPTPRALFATSLNAHSLRRGVGNRSRRRTRSTNQPILPNELRSGLSPGRSLEGHKVPERSAFENGADRHYRGHPASDACWPKTDCSVHIKSCALVVDTRFGSADPRDDGRPGARRDRRCVAVGSDRGLLRDEGQHPDRGRSAREGARRPPWSFGSSWGCGVRSKNWKRDLNKLISENRGEIPTILRSYGGVPLLDENDKPILALTPAPRPAHRVYAHE